MFETIFDIFDGLLKAGSICGILSPHSGLIASGQGPGILTFASDFFFSEIQGDRVFRSPAQRHEAIR